MLENKSIDFTVLLGNIKQWAKTLGFEQLGVSDIDVTQADDHLQVWLKKKFHGCMTYLENHRELRRHPDLLVPGTLRVIMLRMNYLPPNTKMQEILANKKKAYISRYALGRDYHKLIRKKLRE